MLFKGFMPFSNIPHQTCQRGRPVDEQASAGLQLAPGHGQGDVQGGFDGWPQILIRMFLLF